MEITLLIIYGLSLTFIFCYSIVQINLVSNYLKNKRKNEKHSVDEPRLDMSKEDLIPYVTIQLPVYNEKYVTDRLIDSICKLSYPKYKFEIQVLDDSTDETIEMIEKKVKEHLAMGFDIKHIRRADRVGFKAGALAHGLTLAKGEMIAIFDADFLPNPDFLQRTIPYFTDQKIGMVQTRWDHLNKNYSLLTRLQAFGLDAHFSVEQTGRNVAGHFMNFNGTAGVWRKETILDAGGWQADTLTEDLDLSYRAQLKGWKFHFLESCGSPAELPAAMNALKTQQFRWTKGAAECSRKNLSQVLHSRKVSMTTKFHAIFHLLNSSVFICIVITSLLSLPILMIKQYNPQYKILYNIAGVFLLGVLFLSIFYFVSFSRNYKNKWKAFFHFLYHFPLFLSVSMGLSLHNGLAAFEGLIGKKSPFIRTPKFNIKSSNDNWKGNKYLTRKFNPLNIVELLLTIYFGVSIFFAFVYQDFGLLPFHIMLMFGFGYVSIFTLFHSLSASGK